MTLYLLEWDNGLEDEDHSVALLGIYLSKEERDAAKARYDGYPDQWPFYGRLDGNYVEYAITANTDIVARK